MLLLGDGGGRNCKQNVPWREVGRQLSRFPGTEWRDLLFRRRKVCVWDMEHEAVKPNHSSGSDGPVPQEEKSDQMWRK
jgi:hypothetical protein